MERGEEEVAEALLGGCVQFRLRFRTQRVESRLGGRFLQALERIGDVVHLLSLVEGRQDDGDNAPMGRR